MPSKQSEAVRDYWRSAAEAARTNPNRTPDEVREQVEKYWPALTAEPGGLDYLEAEVAGRPALWAVPKGAAEDRVILCVHGGGGVSGSIYTHRKLFGHLAKATGARALLTGYSRLPHPAPLAPPRPAGRADRGVPGAAWPGRRRPAHRCRGRFARRGAVHRHHAARPRSGPAHRRRVDADIAVGGHDGQQRDFRDQPNGRSL